MNSGLTSNEKPSEAETVVPSLSAPSASVKAKKAKNQRLAPGFLFSLTAELFGRMMPPRNLFGSLHQAVT